MKAFLTSLFPVVMVVVFVSRGQAAQLPSFDFTRTESSREWGNAHHISSLRGTEEGLEITIAGDDPYFYGPARDYPAGVPLWAALRLKADQAGTGEIFYFRNGPRPEDAVQFAVPGGKWTEVRVPLPALGTGYRLRIDPPGTRGKLILARMDFEERVSLEAPVWPVWKSPLSEGLSVLRSGEMELFANTASAFGIEVRVNGSAMSVGYPNPRIGYFKNKQVRWIDLAAKASGRRNGLDWEVVSEIADPDGGRWSYRQTFKPDRAGSFAIQTRLTVDQDREILFLPMQLFVAGAPSFGTNKHQALFPGLEYLENEPSSSEVDIIGPESHRRVPVSAKVTLPLMALEADHRYFGFVWEDSKYAALFDSPDRTFGSGRHVMGLIFPGSDATNREEGQLLPYRGELLKANTPLIAKGWLIGGAGKSVVPAVQKYVELRGWPALPKPGLSFADYVSLQSKGWLDSKCREGDLYRHAFWPGFTPQPAADAAFFEIWIGNFTEDHERGAKLRSAAEAALKQVGDGNFLHSGVGHIRGPTAPLVFGGVPEAVAAAKRTAVDLLRRFEPDGSVLYRAGKVDYARTHYAKEANGLTAQVVASLLEAAAFSGDRELISQGLLKLRSLDRFRNTVPRGAQTWEVPLHTPDILASAHLVHAYVLGYELTGEAQFLEQAQYWAWTGVPFVYLANPTGQEIGTYATIAVLGATSWKAPVWFGRPVQWCGLVYADALYRLNRIAPGGPWKNLADGITSAGIQMSWKSDDLERVGLLPDFYELQSQMRAGPAINPATVGACAVNLYGRGPLWDRLVLHEKGVIVHAPGAIVKRGRDRFEVNGWPKDPYYILLSGLKGPNQLLVNGVAARPMSDSNDGSLILRVEGVVSVELKH